MLGGHCQFKQNDRYMHITVKIPFVNSTNYAI